MTLYVRSPALIPKPHDWKSHIAISGFCHLPLATSYVPSPSLLEFLESGPQPIYIGFGSIVVSDPLALSKIVLQAVEKAGVRAIISRGWGSFAANEMEIRSNVFTVDDVPHDWLFSKVSCVVHHGGAGTTAAGIAAGKPTVIVPFFGDQPFWGLAVARAGAGPEPLPFKELTSDSLAAGIITALQSEVCKKAIALGQTMNEEAGTVEAAKSFHDSLNIDALRCSLSPNRTAVWRLKNTNIRLSALSATVLIGENLLKPGDIKRLASLDKMLLFNC